MTRICIIIFCISVNLLNSQEFNNQVLGFISKISKDSLYSYIEELTGEKQVYIDGKLTTVNRNSSVSNETAAKYLRQKLEGYGYNVEISNCSSSYPGTENVLAKIPGSVYPNEYVLFCAHYDSFSKEGDFAPGAIDNASGCAVILEAARLLKDYIPTRSIVFAFWDSEEKGLYGSNCQASLYKKESKKISAVINMDMIGYTKNKDNKTIINLANFGKSTQIWNMINSINELYYIGLFLDSNKTTYEGSDIYSFWKKGFAGVSFSEYDSYPDAHTKDDKIQNIYFPYYYKNAKISIATLLHIDKFGTATNIDDVAIKDNSISIKSNIISDYLHVVIGKEFPTSTMAHDIKIFDSFGKEILINFLNTSEDELIIDTESYTNAIYFIKIGNIVRKFIVMK